MMIRCIERTTQFRDYTFKGLQNGTSYLVRVQATVECGGWRPVKVM